MGTTITNDNNIVTIENAFFLILDTEDKYSIVTSPLAFHNLDKGIIEGTNCTWASFSMNSEDIKPTEQLQCKEQVYNLTSKKGFVVKIEDFAGVTK